MLCVQVLSDMGAALDWFAGLYLRFGWKSAKLVMGPMWYMLVCLHPDTCKVVLRGGSFPFCHSLILVSKNAFLQIQSLI